MSYLNSSPDAASPISTDAQWAIRPYRDGDIPSIVALINAADAVDKFDRGTTESDFRVRLEGPRSDPQRELIVVEGPRPGKLPPGMPIGYGWIPSMEDSAAGERFYEPRFIVHPAARGQGLEETLLRQLLTMARLREEEPATTRLEKVYVRVFIRQADAASCELWSAAGLREVRRFWVMYRPLDQPIDEPRHIEGITVRPYRLNDDNERALEAFNNSFADHYDFQPDTQEEWNHAVGSPSCRLDLSWLAEQDDAPGKLAGFCICWVYSEQNKISGRSEGWIDILGTTRDWRGKGLGRSLLLHGLHSLKSAGLDNAILGVDSDSPTGANRLYESAGFRVRHVTLNYRAALSDVEFA